MTDTTELSRREMILATAAVLVTPLLQGGAVTAQPAVLVPAKFLTPAEYALLEEVTEVIIPADDNSPGARAADVAGYIDGRLAESLEPDWQTLWRSGLPAVGGLSPGLNGKAVLEATPEQGGAGPTPTAAGGSGPPTGPETAF